MEVREILEHFRYNRGRFAREAVLAAIERREEITPHLLHIIEDTTARSEEILKSEDHHFAHLYAFYLLSQFRERHAYPLIATLFSIPGDTCERLTEDFITEDLHRVFAAVAHGDTGPVKKIIESPSANQWARSAAIRSIVAMVAIGEHPRQEAVEYFRDLTRECLSRDDAEDDFGIWDSLVSAATDLYPQELYPEIQRAFDEQLINRFYINLDDVDRVLKRGREVVLAELPTTYPLITDTVAEMEWWACFEDDDRERRKQSERRAGRGGLHPRKAPSTAGREAAATSSWTSGRGNPREPWVETIVRDTPKLGRNDPCSCGSGKKYKKCCGKAAP